MGSFLGGLLGGVIGKIIWLIGIMLGLEKAGEEKQRTKDVEATQNAEQQAADARNATDTDPTYDDELQRRYTDRSD